MLVFAAILLIVNAIFNAIVWPQFWKRVAKDPRASDEQGRATKFLKAHAVLIGIAMLLAVASAIAGFSLLF